MLKRRKCILLCSVVECNRKTIASTTSAGGSNSRKTSNRRGVAGASRKATIGDGGITVGLSGIEFKRRLM